MKKILIISKDQEIQGSIASIHQLSSDLKAKVIGVAEDYPQTLSYIKKTIPDLIVCDTSLYQELDGIALMRRIAQKYPIATLFVADVSYSSIMEKAQDIPVVGYSTKPLMMEQLKITLKLSLNALG